MIPNFQTTFITLLSLVNTRSCSTRQINALIPCTICCFVNCKCLIYSQIFLTVTNLRPKVQAIQIFSFHVISLQLFITWYDYIIGVSNVTLGKEKSFEGYRSSTSRQFKTLMKLCFSYLTGFKFRTLTDWTKIISRYFFHILSFGTCLQQLTCPLQI